MKVITSDNFQQDVVESKKLVLMDVWAPWCGPCRSMMPIVEDLSEELKGKVEVVKLDASEQMELTQKLEVSSLPTFLVFKDGQIVASSIGATSKANLLNLVSQAK